MRYISYNQIGGAPVAALIEVARVKRDLGNRGRKPHWILDKHLGNRARSAADFENGCCNLGKFGKSRPIGLRRPDVGGAIARL